MRSVAVAVTVHLIYDTQQRNNPTGKRAVTGQGWARPSHPERTRFRGFPGCLGQTMWPRPVSVGMQTESHPLDCVLGPGPCVSL